MSAEIERRIRLAEGGRAAAIAKYRAAAQRYKPMLERPFKELFLASS